MIGKHFRFVIMAAVLLTAPITRATELSPWDEWRLGYTNFEIGEQKRSRGDYTAALTAFEKSRTHYLSVKRARPDWNQKVIRERLNACDKQISELRRLLGDKAPASPADSSGKTADAPAAGSKKTKPVPDEVVQLRKLRAELAEARSELEEFRNERARRGNYETEIANLLRDRKIAREKYALLEKRCQKLQEDIKKPESALQELRRQLVEKNERLADAEKSIRLLEERLRRGERGAWESTRERNQLRSQLRQAQEEQQRLVRETGTLRSAVEEERARLAKSNTRIAELERALQEAEKSLKPATSGGDTAVKQEELAHLRNVASAAEKRAEQFQRQCLELRGECAGLMKKLQGLELLQVKYESDISALRGDADKQRTRAESLADELANVRELQRRQEAELKRTLAEIEPLRARLARRDSEDFKGMVAARDAVRKLEAEISVLKTKEAELTVALVEERKSTASLDRELNIVRGEVRKAKGAQKSAEQELESVRAEAERYRELLPKHQALERNFTALRQENQENRVKLAAASPREAELRRIKLRLVELDQLKSSLGREQRLNAELLAEKKKQQEELKVLRDKSAQLAVAQKQLETMKALQREVSELRRVNREAVSRLEKMKNLEGELVTAKRALIEGGAAQLELHEVKQAYAKAVGERNAAATEAARLRDMLAAAQAEVEKAKLEASKTSEDAARALEKSRQQLLDAQAEAESARREASRVNEEAARALEKSRQQLLAAQAEAERSKREASEANIGAARALEKSRQQLLVVAQAEAERSRREASAANEEAAQALGKSREQLLAAQAEAERSRREASAANEEVARALEKSRQQLLAAQAEAEKSRIEASRVNEEAARALEESRRQLLAAQAEAERSKREASAANEEVARALEKSRRQLLAVQAEAERSKREASEANIGAAQALEKSRQQLLAANEKLAQLEGLVPQIEKLRKLNDELMYARSFEAELVKARTQLGELSRYKDELAGVIRLNEQLIKEKTELEKELASRRAGTFTDDIDEQNRLIAASSKEKPDDYVAEGMMAESDGNTELAIWNYRKALDLERNHAAACERLGLLLLRREEFAEAARLLAIARSSSPDRLDLALAVSRAYLGQKRFGNAQAVVDPLLRNHPENGELLTVAAMAASEGGDAVKAEKYLKLAMRYLPKSPEPRLEFSRLLVRHDSSRMEEAARSYEIARLMGAAPDIELEPALGPRLDKRREMEQFLTSAMNEAFDNRDYYGAAWYCKQLLEINRRPQYFTPLLALSRLLGGESGSARETLTFNAESAQGALVLALVELKDGNRPAFSAAVRRALALNKGNPVTINLEWRNLGLALDAAGVADRAAGKELSRAYKWEEVR